MKNKPASYTSCNRSRGNGLYNFVFRSTCSGVVVLLLVASLFIQTVEQAFANEQSVTDQEVSLPVVTDDTIDRINASDLANLPTPPSVDVSTDETIVEPASPPPSTEVTDVSNPDIPPVEEVVEPPTDPTEEIPIQTEEVASSTDPIASTTATTTDESVSTFTQESNTMIQFSKDNCLAVEDGSYYCQKVTTATQPKDELFAAPDSDGDLEIYLERQGELRQLTHNTVDDAAPVYDGASDSIVWHRSINDVYQIIVYDVASGEEVQLTDTTTNNMEPFRADNYITWQYWENDAWQIMLYDGGAIQTLTATYEHNLAPTIRNGLVVWHRITGAEKTIEVYNIREGSYVSIKDTEGGSIGNPRMVLVYDAQMDNGDVITRGYDMMTGEITTFTQEPAPLPEEIPEPDATGETRALINSKTQSDEDGETTGSSTPVIGDDIDTTPVASSTAPLVLDLSTTTTDYLDMDIVPAPVNTVMIEDLIIPPYTPLDIATSS